MYIYMCMYIYIYVMIRHPGGMIECGHVKKRLTEMRISLWKFRILSTSGCVYIYIFIQLTIIQMNMHTCFFRWMVAPIDDTNLKHIKWQPLGEVPYINIYIYIDIYIYRPPGNQTNQTNHCWEITKLQLRHGKSIAAIASYGLPRDRWEISMFVYTFVTCISLPM